jgi:hypothetical protein
MPLTSIWSTNPAAVEQFTIEQVVNIAGDGNLRDNSECSNELRSYFSEVKSAKLAEYVERCLTTPFQKGGIVLQDLVNELGKRLDYQVINGRYQGTTNTIGFDGIWQSPESHSIVVEVKTTDAYRISLDTIAEYRDKLLKAGQLSNTSSILMIVGRQDTGDLEAQVRGSRHAWDIRIISAEALIRLVQLKEDSEAAETGKKIRSLLVPKEYTRLDAMIDVMFATAKDVEGAVESEEEDTSEPPSDTPSTKVKGIWQFTDSNLLQAKREDIIDALGRREGAKLIKKSRALYWHPGRNVRAACSVSKRYVKRAAMPYWYAYHPQWDQFLGEGPSSFFVLGCMDRLEAFAIPLDIIRSHLTMLNVTEREDDSRYWHIHLSEDLDGELSLALPKTRSSLPLKQYKLKLSS